MKKSYLKNLTGKISHINSEIFFFSINKQCIREKSELPWFMSQPWILVSASSCKELGNCHCHLYKTEKRKRKKKVKWKSVTFLGHIRELKSQENLKSGKTYEICLPGGKASGALYCTTLKWLCWQVREGWVRLSWGQQC